MTLTQGPIRLAVLVVGAFALLLGLGLAASSTTHAQGVPGARYFGTAEAGDSVEAFIDGVSCGDAVTADSDGLWILDVPGDADCSPSGDDTVTFELNGAAAEETESWRAGGTSADTSTGTTLTAGEAVDDEPTVSAPETGNAGLLASQGGTSPWLALSLGALALAMLGGARALTRRS